MIRLFRVLGPDPALHVVVIGGPKLLELFLTLEVGLDGVVLETEFDRLLVCLPQSLHSHALDKRASISSRRALARCSASSLYIA